MPPYYFIFSFLFLYLIGASFILFVFFTILFICDLIWQKKNAKKLYLVRFLWLTVSIMLPYVAKKYDLIKRKWVRWLLVFISPAAIATLYFPVSCFLSMDLPCKCSTLGTMGEGISRLLINYHTGVNFPSMSYVTGNFEDYRRYYSNICTMKLKEKPNQELIQEIEQSEEWQKGPQNLNIYYRKSWHENEGEIISFDIKKGEIHLEYAHM